MGILNFKMMRKIGVGMIGVGAVIVALSLSGNKFLIYTGIGLVILGAILTGSKE